ncbi:hypothetical protein GCM10007989_02950 [Devosia pacifica]|uniref:VOC domain-containing protein n=1 Tax=Devosia pacifica TaxID=1335967 RepID=A0A918VLY4_9HYPH|nr:hypothetical protein GCM10007989_02950 [Devosia pacifica]
MPAPAVKQIAHVCIFAHDLDATEAFYRNVFGLQKAFTFMRGETCIGYYLDLGGRTFFEVFHKDEAKFSETDQINHICLEVENLDDTIAHIRQQGVEITDKKVGSDGTWQAWTKDPNGVKLEIFEYTAQSKQFTGGICQVNW